MNRAALIRGAVGGVAGGVLMALWSMIAMGLTGAGFWAPLNLIAHTVFPSAPLDGVFSLPALVIGLVIHLAMSIAFGVVFAALMTSAVGWVPTTITSAFSGVAYGIVAWLVMQVLLWPAADAVAAAAFTPWIFAVGHLIYGLTIGLVVGPVQRMVRRPQSRPDAV